MKDETIVKTIGERAATVYADRHCVALTKMLFLHHFISSFCFYVFVLVNRLSVKLIKSDLGNPIG